MRKKKLLLRVKSRLFISVNQDVGFSYHTAWGGFSIKKLRKCHAIILDLRNSNNNNKDPNNWYDLTTIAKKSSQFCQ